MHGNTVENWVNFCVINEVTINIRYSVMQLQY